MQTIIPCMMRGMKRESPSTTRGKMALFLAHLNSRIYEATAWQVIFQTMNLPGSTEREAKKFCHNVLMTINTNSYPSGSWESL